MIFFTCLTLVSICPHKNIYCCTIAEVKAESSPCQCLFGLLDAPLKNSAHSKPVILFLRRGEILELSYPKALKDYYLAHFFFPSRTTLIQQGHCPLPVGYSDLCYAATSSEEHNDVACGHNSHRSQT